MPADALALVLAAAVAHAVWNLAATRVRGHRVLFVWWYVAVATVLWVPLAVVVAVRSGQQPAWSWLAVAAVSALLHVAYNLVLQHGYAVGDLGVVYPVARGVGPLLTLAVAVLVLGERPGPAALLGALLVLAGVGVVTWPGAAARFRLAAGLRWGALTGVAIAGYTLWDHHAVARLEVPPLSYFALGLLLQMVPLGVPAWSRRRGSVAVLSTYRWEVLSVAVLSPLAYVLVLQALTLAPVSLVAPARESSIVVGALLGWLVLREPDPGRRLLGTGLVVAGIALMAVG